MTDNASFLYSGRILFIDLSSGKITTEPTSLYASAFLGGRGINVKLLYESVPPEISPLDPAASLIFGVGPLCGTPVPASRTEITARSPETGYIGLSNFGGYFGPEMKFAGYDHIAITGRAEKPVYVWINNEHVEIRDAGGLWGQDTYRTQEILRSEVDLDAKIACIGIAGEKLVHFASVQHELGHGGGRLGMGAVMGSKNLKAIAIRGTGKVRIARPDEYLEIVKNLHRDLLANPLVRERKEKGHTPELDKMRRRAYGDHVPMAQDLVLKYNARRTGCLGCPGQCMDLYPKEAKGGGAITCTRYVQPLDIVKNTDLELVLECSLAAQRWGIDVISTFGTISWLMELHEKGTIGASDTDGIAMEWGSRSAILEVFRKIVNREGVGDVLADGILPAARQIGRGAIEYANQVKGLPMYDKPSPERLVPMKGMALCNVVSSRGDHMNATTQHIEEDQIKNISTMFADKQLGQAYIEEARRKVWALTGTDKGFIREEYEGKAELTVWSEDGIVINDCLSVCKLLSSYRYHPFNEPYEAALLSAGTGIHFSEEALFEFAKRIVNLERAYNTRAGMTRKDDCLPERYMDRPLTKGAYAGSVLESTKFEQMKDRYYELRGWDVATGIPRRDTLERSALGFVTEDLDKRRLLPTT